MTASHSTAFARSCKPAKPTPDFPLFPHATGRWAKKIRGRMVYFGPWADPDGALKRYQEQAADLHAGRKPREVTPEADTIKELCNSFLNSKRVLVEGGELSPRTMIDYEGAVEVVVQHLGKTRLVADVGPDDFAAMRNKMARKWGPFRLAKMIQCVRSIFKYGFDSGMIDRPMRFGPGFKRPSKKTLRKERHKKGPNLFTAAEVQALLGKASIAMRAMILLGVNAGFGPSDCGSLPLTALDLAGGWIDYPRPKTEVPRRCPLWPETVEALHQAVAERPTPKDPDAAGLVFVTQRGNSWNKDTSDTPVSKEIAKLLKALGINGRKGVGFYTLRHTFRTVADAAKDQPAADFIMGHESPHMSSHYRESIGDERLQAVSSHVRQWLFGAGTK